MVWQVTGYSSLKLLKAKVANMIDIVQDMLQTILFHLKTFNPSIIPKGMRLKKAIQALKAAPNIATMKNCFDRLNARKMKKNIETVVLVKGPARAVLPFILLLVDPAIITAPGEINLIGEKIESKVIKAPKRVNLNSAHKP